MPVSHTIGKTTIQISVGDNLVDAFETLAKAEEIFGNAICGACGGNEVLHVVRKNGEYEFFEIVCQNQKCKAKLSFYRNDEKGQFFASRKEKDGSWKPNSGWVIWGKEDQEKPSFKPKRQPAAAQHDRDDSPF